MNREIRCESCGVSSDDYADLLEIYDYVIDKCSLSEKQWEHILEIRNRRVKHILTGDSK